MEQKADTVDVEDMPELARMVDRVLSSGGRCVLRQGGQDVAVLVPIRSPRGTKDARHQRRIALSLAAMGSWQGLVDAEHQ